MIFKEKAIKYNTIKFSCNNYGYLESQVKRIKLSVSLSNVYFATLMVYIKVSVTLHDVTWCNIFNIYLYRKLIQLAKLYNI